MRGWIRRLRSSGGLTALVAQGTAFLAMLVPIVAGRFDEVSALVFSSALCTVLLGASSGAVQSIYPRVATDQEAEDTLAGAVLSLLLASVLLGGALAIAATFQTSSWMFVVLTTAQFVGQAAYIVAMAVLVRRGDFAVLARARTLYSFVLLASTLIAVWVADFRESLIAVSALAFLAGACAAAPARSAIASTLRALPNVTFGALRSYWSRSWPAAMADLWDGLSSQVGGLLVPFLGAMSGAWAVGTRVAGGFSTIGFQLLAPAFEMPTAQLLRSGDVVAARRVIVRAVLAGATLALIAGATGLGVMAFAVAEAGLGGDEVAMLIVGYLGYACVPLIYGVVARMLVMAGGERQKAAWGIGRLLLIVACVFLAPRDWMLGGLAMAAVLAVAVYLLLLARQVKGFPREGENSA